MKTSRFVSLLILAALAAEPAFAASSTGTSSVLTLFTTIENQMRLVATVAMSCIIMWAGYCVMSRGQTLNEVGKLIAGGIMIGAAGWIASLFVG